MTARTVVVGASIGGVRTAQALRAAGYSGEVVLVGDEPSLPYDKPPLSKSLLAGTTTTESATLLTEQAAAEADIQLVLGAAATRLEVADRTVELANGRRLDFDDVVVATGGRPRPSPWGEPPGVHLLRTLDEAVTLGAALRRGGPLVVIGAGFIGAEVAATARGMDVEDVTVVDPVPVPLSRVLNPAVAELLGQLHTDRGVTTRFGVGVTAIDPSYDGLTVRLTDGSALPAAVVVVGIGAVPNDEWLRSSGLQVDDGLVCDRYSRAVGVEHVHAVGDVARWYHPRHRRLVRIEHWTNAVEQAVCVAHNITHHDRLRSHEPVEYVWSDQYDWKIQLAGRTGGDLDHAVVPGPGSGTSFAVLYAEDGRFVGAATVNWAQALIACRRAVRGGARVTQVRDTVQAPAKRSEVAR